MGVNGRNHALLSSILGLGMTRPYTPEATLELGGVAQCKHGCTRRLVQEVTKLNVYSGKPAAAARERPARWDWAHSDKEPTRTVKTESLQPSQNTILTEECVVFPELTTGHVQSMFWSQIDALIGRGNLKLYGCIATVTPPNIICPSPW